MTKTTPEKSKARENNERGEEAEEGSLTETEMSGGIHAALPAPGAAVSSDDC